MFHLSLGSEDRYITFHITTFRLDGRKSVPLFVFRGDDTEGQANKLYCITSLQNAVETLGEPNSIAYKALWNMIQNNWCTFYVIRTNTSFVDAIDKVIAEGVYPDVDALVETYAADIRETLALL